MGSRNGKGRNRVHDVLRLVDEEVGDFLAEEVEHPRHTVLRDFDDGLQLAPDHRFGNVTWSDWLSRPTLPAAGPGDAPDA